MERKSVNNDFYETLNDQWHSATDHPVALLRAENALRNPWIASILDRHFSRPCTLLDVGCGGGFLTHYLAERGHLVTGVDLSPSSLEIAKKNDKSASVQYIQAEATALPFLDNSFDAVAAMDLLEHIERPDALVKEVGRLLKPGGLFFFHTFNRTFLSWLMVIKGVEWFVPNTPENMHLYSHFIKPRELERFCQQEQLFFCSLKGVRPKFSPALWKLLRTRELSSEFSFTFCPSLSTGYCGFAEKNSFFQSWHRSRK